MLESTFDIAFIGALNIDHIFSLGTEPDQNIEALLDSDFLRNREKQSSLEHVQSVLQRMSHYPSIQQLSGSSFIAMHTVSAMRLGLRLACVGVEGVTTPTPTAFSRWLDRRGIDRRFVFDGSPDPAATCIAATYMTQRSLLTSPGANRSAGARFSDTHDALVSFLSSCRRIHITSFFDDHTPAVVVSIATEARARNPLMKCSIDPGSRWISEKVDVVHNLMRLANDVFLNADEFETLFGVDRWREIMGACMQTGPLSQRIFKKEASKTTIFQIVAGDLQSTEIPHQRLPTTVIVDDTGAGDVFAGAILAAESAAQVAARGSVNLAVLLAQDKLRRVGQDFSAFAEIARLHLFPGTTS